MTFGCCCRCVNPWVPASGCASRGQGVRSSCARTSVPPCLAGSRRWAGCTSPRADVLYCWAAVCDCRIRRRLPKPPPPALAGFRSAAGDGDAAAVIRDRGCVATRPCHRFGAAWGSQPGHVRCRSKAAQRHAVARLATALPLAAWCPAALASPGWLTSPLAVTQDPGIRPCTKQTRPQCRRRVCRTILPSATRRMSKACLPGAHVLSTCIRPPSAAASPLRGLDPDRHTIHGEWPCRDAGSMECEDELVPGTPSEERPGVSEHPGLIAAPGVIALTQAGGQSRSGRP